MLMSGRAKMAGLGELNDMLWSDVVDESAGHAMATIKLPAQMKRCGHAMLWMVRAPIDAETRAPDQGLVG